MRSFTLENGEFHIVKNDFELIDIIEKHMGYDMSCVFKDLVEKADYNERKLDSDLLSYESSLEECRDDFSTLGDMLDSISKELESKKLNRVKIKEIIYRMERLINQNI